MVSFYGENKATENISYSSFCHGKDGREKTVGVLQVLVNLGLCAGQMECVIIFRGGAPRFSEKQKDSSYFCSLREDGGGNSAC